MTQPTTITVTADVTSAVRGLRDVVRAATLTKTEFKALGAAAASIVPILEDQVKGISQTLSVYKQLIDVSSKYRANLEKAASSNTMIAASAREMSLALTALKTALIEVEKTTKRDYESRSRTLDLYSRMIGLTQQASQLKLNEATATEKLTRAQATQLASELKLEAAKRRAATAAAPPSGPTGGRGLGPSDVGAANKNLGTQFAAAQAAARALDSALGRAGALAERSARNRLTIAQGEIQAQQQILETLLRQYHLEEEIATAARAKVTGPGASTDVADINAAAAAEQRVAATARAAAQAVRDLAAAEQARLRAERELQGLQAQSNKRADNQITAQQKMSEALRQNEAAQRAYDAAAARGVSLAEKDAQNRVALAEEEIKRQQRIVNMLLTRANVEHRLSVEATARAVRTGTTGDSAAAAAANARSAAAIREATTAQRNLTSAQLEGQRAARALATAEEEAAAAATGDALAEEKLSGHLASTRYAMYQVAAAYGIVSRLAFQLSRDVVKFGAEYEAAFAQVVRATNSPKAELVGLYNSLEELDTQIPVTFADLARIAQLGAQMGIDPSQLVNFTEVIAKFSATTQVATEDAAASFGKISNLLDVPVAQFENLASTVAYLGVTSVATEPQILAVATSISAAGHTAGLSTTEILGLASAFASLAVPPEQARSAMQRLFVNINQAISEGGQDLQNFANYMGLTTAQVANLVKTNPDKFFNDLMIAFSRTIAAGGDITGVLGDLSITSVRDIGVFEKLGGAWDLVAQNLRNANGAFKDGTYLQEAFAKINDTVAAKAQKVADAYQNLVASIGNSAVVQGAVKGVLDVLKDVLTFLEKLPPGVTVAITTFVTLLGVFAAYKAGLALLIAGTLAFRQTAQNGLGTAAVTIRALRLALNSSTIATQQQNAATAQLGATTATATGAINAQTGALRGQAAAAAAAAGAASAGAGAAGAAGAGAAVKGAGTLVTALKGFASPLVVTGLIAFATATVEHVQAVSHAAEEAAANYKAFQESIIASGGGMDSLAKAIKEDTLAWEADGKVANEVNGVYQTVELSAIPAADAIGQVVKAHEDVAGATGTSADALSTETLALGKNTLAWERNALAESLLSGKVIDTKTLNDFQKEGVDIATAIAAGLQGNTDQFETILFPFLRKWQTELTGVKQRQDDLQLEILKSRGRETPEQHQELVDLATRRKYIEDLIQGFWDLQKATDATSGAVKDGINSGSIYTKIIDILTQELDGGADGEDRLKAGLEGVDKATKDATKSTTDLAGAFQEMLGFMTDIVGLSSDIYSAIDDLGKAIADNGPDFTLVTEAGRDNMEKLMNLVNAYGAQIANQIAQGTITAQEGAQQMQSYMVDLVTGLGNIGVPTDQIDFLVNYLTQIVNTNWGISVGADVSGAINGLNTVASYAAQVEAAINNMISNANLTATQALSGYNILEGAAMQGYGAGVAPNATASTVQYTGPTTFRGNVSFQKYLEDAHAAQVAANAAKAAADAQKQAAHDSNAAAKEAKSAAQAAQDAADKAAAAAKAQEDYLKAAADYFGSFASDSTSMIDLTGNVYESLQKLGVAIAQNGTRFNVYTQAGRDNWSALESALSSYGDLLSNEVTNGTLTAAQAMVKYKSYAQGVYSELLSLGVPAADLDAYFKTLGIDSSGWAKAADDVKIYAGFITAAADATGNLLKQTKDTADYVSRLGDALNHVQDSFYGLRDAQDAVATQYNQMKQNQADEQKQIQDLIDKNKELNQTIQDQTVVANKAYTNYLLAKKYGETGRAADYLQQYRDARGQITTARGQINANNAQIGTLKSSKNLLTGNSNAAIANRKSLEDLTNAYKDQIVAYANAGHTQAEVTAYAKTLKAQFDAQALSLGYTRNQLKPYDADLNTLIATIKKIPAKVSTTIDINTDPANAGINAFPTGATYTIKAHVDKTTRDQVLLTLKNLPKQSDFVVTPKVAPNATRNALLGGSGSIGIPIHPTVTPAARTSVFGQVARTFQYNPISLQATFHSAELNSVYGQVQRRFTDHPISLEGTFKNGFTATVVAGGSLIMKPIYKGGLIGGLGKGYAAGGLLPGTPPANPTVDNLMATGPGGVYQLRSREYVQPQPSVEYYGVSFMNALRDRRIPRDHFYASGGMVGGGSVGGGGDWSGPTELSPYDRQLLRQIRDAQPTVIVGDSAVAASSARGGANNARRGGF